MSRLLLHARMAGHMVAMPADLVDSVVALDLVVPVPGAPAGVRGLAALRSRVVTVIDPGVTLGGGTTPGNRAVITAHDGQLYAVLVEALDDVAPAAEQAMIAGLAAPAAWNGAVLGMVLRGGAPVAVVDPRALIPQPAAAA